MLNTTDFPALPLEIPNNNASRNTPSDPGQNVTIDVTSNGDVSDAKDTCNIISEKNPSNVTHAALSVDTDDASHGDVSDGPNNAVDGTDTPNNYSNYRSSMPSRSFTLRFWALSV